MQKRAEPPQESLPRALPATWISGPYTGSADEILQWLRGLPEGSVKEREKARLLTTRFRDLLPSRWVGRPRKHDMAAVALVVEAPLLQQRLRAVKRDLRRQRCLEPHGLVSKPAGRETPEQHVQRITPLVRNAWREHREALWPGEAAPKDPPDAVLAALIQAAIKKHHAAPNLAELGAQLLAWRWGLLSPRPRAIRKLITRGKELRNVGPRNALRKDSYF